MLYDALILFLITDKVIDVQYLWILEIAFKDELE